MKQLLENSRTIVSVMAQAKAGKQPLRKTSLALAIAATLAFPAFTYAAPGDPGSELRVNTTTVGKQLHPTIAVDADGDFVVAWESFGQDGSGYGIYAQRYNAARVRQGGEFRVNTTTVHGQRYPTIALDADGDFVVAWRSISQDGRYDIYAQRYSAAGVRQGDEFRVNTTTDGEQVDPTIALDADGDFVVAWVSLLDPLHNRDYVLNAQRYNAAGVRQGGEFRVNTTAYRQPYPTIALDADGDFVVAWASFSQGDSGYDIHAQRYSAAGVRQGGVFRVNTTIASDQIYPTIALDADGDFVVAWQSYGQDGTSIYAQRYKAAGARQGGEFQVNTTTVFNSQKPDIGLDIAGDFVVAWDGFGYDDSGPGVYAQRYNAAGLTQGSEFRVNTTTINDLFGPAIGLDADGDFVVAWDSNNQDSLDDIYAQRYTGGVTPDPCPQITSAAPVGAANLAAEQDMRGTSPDGKHGPMAKVGMDLAQLYREHQEATLRRLNGAFTPSNPMASLSRSATGEDLVVIDAAAEGDAKALLADLEKLGLQKGAYFGRMVSGWLPITAIPAMAALPNLRLARMSMMTTHAGATTSQGDVAQKSNVARGVLGVSGAGITIGTLSDSFNCKRRADNDVASGDLPAGVKSLNDSCVVLPLHTDEGRAIMQVIHDIAPGAKQVFNTAADGQVNFMEGILRLATAPTSAKVIVDDFMYFDEPMFQDGIIAQAVDKVVAAGTAYFSAAGNQAKQSYESAYRVTCAKGPSDGALHDFDSGPGVDFLQSITIPVNTAATFTLQWDQPFFSNIKGSPGSANDIDIFLVNAAGNQTIKGGTTNNVGGDPVDQFTFKNPGPGTAFNIAIERARGVSPGKMKYVIHKNLQVTINEFDTSGTIYGHANAAGAEAVGAARYFNTPQCGVNPPLLEFFSSVGGTPILFDITGKRLAAPIIRQKPRIVAPDGVNTTFFGMAYADRVGPCASTEPFPNFFGTSAAAPHAAAVAALLRQANPVMTPAAVYSRLENTAIDMGTAGFDFDSGFGLIQADVALGICNGRRATITGTPGTDTLNGTSGNDVILGLGGNDTINGLGGNDALCGGAGNDILNGGDGDDTLAGQADNDTLNGDLGNDLARFSEAPPPAVRINETPPPAGITANLTAGTASGEGNDTLRNIENLIGSRFNDNLTGNAASNILIGLSGNDRLDGQGGNDYASFILASGSITANLTTNVASGDGSDTLISIESLIGSSYNDTLTGNASGNVLNGLDGNDTLNGLGGNDTLLGGNGNDKLDGGTETDTCNGEAQTTADTAVNCETVTGVP